MKRPGAPRRGRLAISAAVAALACLITAAPAQAAPPTAPPPSTGGDLTEESRAVARSQDSGTPVEVASARTETGEVHAMPDGTLRLTQHAAPVRTQRDGVWKDIDTTLSTRDGRVAPRSAAGDVSFSGGGDGPLAVLTDQGRSVELSWPETLPAPVLQGNTATYRNVLDGVDLAVTAQVDGFSHVLVVHSAEAAAEPALKEISYGLKGEGVTVERDAESNTLRAVNPAGQELFATATPRMWDSGDAPAQRSQGARSADTLSPVDPLAPDVRSAEVGMKTSDSTLTLTPDPELLRGEETSYPVYIDPNFSGSKLAWTIAYDRHKSSSFWNGTNWTGSYANEARVGYESDTKGTSRAFFRLNSKELAGATVLSAQFQITNTYSWSCQARNVELWLTGGISASTTWNKQPSWATHLQTKSFAHGYTGCGAKSVDFNATEAAKRSAANGWANITLGLRASSESDTFTWKRFNSNPKIIVSYNRTPNTALAMETRPSTANDTACAVAPYVFVGNTDVTLRARVSDPDGDKVTARFHLWPTGKHPNDAADGVFVVNVDKTNITSGGWAEHTVSKDTLKKYEGFGSGGRFSWKVQARDAHSASDWLPTQGAPGCQFGFDSARPSALPQVSSPEFPGSGDGSVGAPARTPGSFTFTSGGVSDVVSYTYGLNVSPPTTKAEPATAGGPVTVRLTPGLRRTAHPVRLQHRPRRQQVRHPGVLLLRGQPGYARQARRRQRRRLPRPVLARRLRQAAAASRRRQRWHRRHRGGPARARAEGRAGHPARGLDRRLLRGPGGPARRRHALALPGRRHRPGRRPHPAAGPPVHPARRRGAHRPRHLPAAGLPRRPRPARPGRQPGLPRGDRRRALVPARLRQRLPGRGLSAGRQRLGGPHPGLPRRPGRRRPPRPAGP
ncbi:hypothetical protein ACWGRT_27820 [Streptomyces albidoflavus]